jgi:hypothetical protein
MVHEDRPSCRRLCLIAISQPRRAGNEVRLLCFATPGNALDAPQLRCNLAAHLAIVVALRYNFVNTPSVPNPKFAIPCGWVRSGLRILKGH